MKIPREFPLFGHTIVVRTIALKDWEHGDNCVGLWNPPTREIFLRSDYHGSGREQVFFHEMIHAILDGLSHPLATDEIFVDQFACLLHQALAGAQYGRTPR